MRASWMPTPLGPLPLPALVAGLALVAAGAALGPWGTGTYVSPSWTGEPTRTVRTVSGLGDGGGILITLPALVAVVAVAPALLQARLPTARAWAWAAVGLFVASNGCASVFANDGTAIGDPFLVFGRWEDARVQWGIVLALVTSTVALVLAAYGYVHARRAARSRRAALAADAAAMAETAD